MTAIPDSPLSFLNSHGLTPESVNVAATLTHFLDEMNDGLTRGTGSLEMIPTFIAADAQLPVGQPAIVIDAGGTNLRVCTVTLRGDGDPLIENFVKFPMPGIGQPVSKDAFFKTLAEEVAPMAHLSDTIGFCFSYPTEILPNRDGRLLRWTKEVQIPDLVGDLVGAGLIKALEAKGFPGKKVVILNDTVACLLAGKIAGEPRRCSDYVGFILGTGTNTAYLEQNAAIAKRTELDLDGSMIINLESGNFAIRDRGTIDKAFDAKTANPNRQTFEKMISGAYLGGLCHEALMTAVRDGVLSMAAGEALKSMDGLTTIHMDNFLGNPYEAGNSLADLNFADDDAECIITICTEIVRRAALLTAINISGTVIKSGHGTSPLHPVCINVDGSTFHKTNNFPRWTLGYLDTILGERGIHYTTVHVDNAPILGAAIAALSNG